MGAGRTELLECVAGRVPMTGGRILLEGDDVSRLSIAERIAKGLALVPEDRQRDGLVQTMSVGENLSLASIAAFVRGLAAVAARGSARWSTKSIRDVRIKTEGGERADRIAVGRQPAESRHRQGAGDPPQGHPAR